MRRCSQELTSPHVNPCQRLSSPFGSRLKITISSVVDRTDHPAILTNADATYQYDVLRHLQRALGELGVSATLARVHHLGLPTEYVHVSGVSGPRPPILFIRTQLSRLMRVRVDGESYVLVSGEAFPAGNPGIAARQIALVALAR
jgi:hypothetical protein